ncbi:hypothetical protein ISR92_02875 [Patescibacteria group bacterium]|nr:hypothetical protein [Patescibacteria group bacterium]
MISDKTNFHAFMDDIKGAIRHDRGTELSWTMVEELLSARAKLLADDETFDSCYPKIREAMEELRNHK